MIDFRVESKRMPNGINWVFNWTFAFVKNTKFRQICAPGVVCLQKWRSVADRIFIHFEIFSANVLSCNSQLKLNKIPTYAALAVERVGWGHVNDQVKYMQLNETWPLQIFMHWHPIHLTQSHRYSIRSQHVQHANENTGEFMLTTDELKMHLIIRCLRHTFRNRCDNKTRLCIYLNGCPVMMCAENVGNSWIEE